MKKIALGFALCLLAVISVDFYREYASPLIAPAYAQTGCSNLGQSQLLNEFADNQAPGSIVPAFVRNLICSVSNLLNATGVTPGNYTSTNITVGADGRITKAANGSGGLNTASGDCSGTVSGSNLPLNCAGLAKTASANTFGSTQTFAGTAVPRRTINSSKTLCAQLAGCSDSPVGPWPGIDNTVCVDVAGGSVTVTMPPGTGTTIPNGYAISINDCHNTAGASKTITIAGNTSQTVCGAGSQVINTSGRIALNAIWNSTDNDWNCM